MGRDSVRLTDPKMREIVHTDFLDFKPIQSQFAGYDACFFCLGVSGVGDAMKLAHTTDLRTYARRGEHFGGDPTLTLCSSMCRAWARTARSTGRSMWARVKGKTENAILALPLQRGYMFRPGFIQPLKGVRSKTSWYQAIYTVIGFAYPLLRRLAPKYVTTTVNVGRAMINVAANGYPKKILATTDIDLGGGKPELRQRLNLLLYS